MLEFHNRKSNGYPRRGEFSSLGNSLTRLTDDLHSKVYRNRLYELNWLFHILITLILLQSRIDATGKSGVTD